MVELTDKDFARYEWQLDIPGFGVEGQKKLKSSSVLVTRCGGLGGIVAYELAAAGVGRIIVCHSGNTKPSDLNRQLLMTTDWVGKPRTESIVRRLKELNPLIEIISFGENVSSLNAEKFVQMADCVVDCAPLFEERFALNSAVVKLKKPMIECAMYSMEAQITTIYPGKTPCLRCLYPQKPEAWKRRFPVFGAVSGMVGCMGAIEAIKVLCQLGDPLLNTMIHIDALSMEIQKIAIQRNPDCRECSHI